MMGDVFVDRLFELRHTLEHAIANPVLRDVPEPPLDHIQPRAARRDEVDVEPLVLLQPLQDLRMLVGGKLSTIRCNSRSVGVAASIFFRNRIHS